MKAVIDAIHDLVRDGGKPEQVWTAPAKNEALIGRVAHFAEAKLRDAYQTRDKQARTDKLRAASAGNHRRPGC
jgi:polyribonucleotide nucleotidyltransferase